MSRLTVAAVQQRMYMPGSLAEYAESLRRFLRVAKNRHAQLVVFPELGGTMAALASLDDTRSKLMKRADRGMRREASPWQRLIGTLSGGLAGYLRADMRRTFAGLLDVSAGQVWETYLALFGTLAEEFSITLVAPSAYLPDPLDGVIRNLAAAFSSSGELVGTQAKVVLHPSDVDFVQPGATWDVIQTELGRIGLIIGGDVLYPEVGRLLAYQGADILVGQAACTDLAMYNKVRAGVLARMQDNQLFAIESFVVGRPTLQSKPSSAYMGKSAIFAPQELTQRYNGVLVEMGGPRSEGVVAAEWDFDALRGLWETSDTPIRRTLTSAEIGSAMSEIYSRLQRLPPVANTALISQATDSRSADEVRDLTTLDELAVIDSFQKGDTVPSDGEERHAAAKNPRTFRKIHGGTKPPVSAEEETDEYDSVPKPNEEADKG